MKTSGLFMALLPPLWLGTTISQAESVSVGWCADILAAIKERRR